MNDFHVCNPFHPTQEDLIGYGTSSAELSRYLTPTSQAQSSAAPPSLLPAETQLSRYLTPTSQAQPSAAPPSLLPAETQLSRYLTPTSQAQPSAAPPSLLPAETQLSRYLTPPSQTQTSTTTITTFVVSDISATPSIHIRPKHTRCFILTFQGTLLKKLALTTEPRKIPVLRKSNDYQKTSSPQQHLPSESRTRDKKRPHRLITTDNISSGITAYLYSPDQQQYLLSKSRTQDKGRPRRLITTDNISSGTTADLASSEYMKANLKV